MKKISFAAIIVLMAVSATSCKRKYNCVCRMDLYENNQYKNQLTDIDEVKSKNRTEAKAACIAKQSEAIDENGFGHKTICDLK